MLKDSAICQFNFPILQIDLLKMNSYTFLHVKFFLNNIQQVSNNMKNKFIIISAICLL